MVEIRREAWRAEPTQQRLLALYQAAGEQARRVMVEEATAEHPELSERLRAASLLLAGRTGDAVELFDEPSGVHDRESADRVLVPYLLTAAAGGPSDPGWDTTLLAGLLRSVDHPEDWEWTVPAQGTGAGASTPLSTLLEGLAAEQQADLMRRDEYLEAALDVVDRRVDVIVGGQQRAWYGEAARLVACCAEAVRFAEDEQSVVTYLRLQRDRYSRHVAYRRELEQAVSGSPILPALPARRR